MKKPKIIPCIITSRESLEATVADVVKLKLQAAELTAAMEQEIAAVQERHKRGILATSHQIDAKEAGIYVYCQANRATLFSQKKSIDLLLATVGFETNPPSVEKLAKKDTWTSIAARLANLDWGQAYIVEPDPEISKTKLIADRAKLTAEQLKQVGIAITQEEQFFIRPKSQIAADTVQAAA